MCLCRHDTFSPFQLDDFWSKYSVATSLVHVDTAKLTREDQRYKSKLRRPRVGVFKYTGDFTSRSYNVDAADAHGTRLCEMPELARFSHRKYATEENTPRRLTQSTICMCVISFCGAFSFTRRDVNQQHRGLVASQQALRSNQIATKLDEFSAMLISRSHRTGGK